MPLFGFTNVAGSVITQTSIAVASGGASDPDAQAFITAASITDPTEISALDQLVIDLKSYNIWTKMKAIYPVLGGSASSHAVNLVTPGTYNLTFSTGWTHASTGMTSNGAAYADTFFNQSTVGQNLNSTHLSFYSRSTTTTNSADIGAVNLAPDNFYSIVTINGGVTYYGNNLNVQGTLSAPTQSGLFLTSRTANNLTKFFRNGVSLSTNTNLPSVAINRNVWVGARNSNTSILYGNKQCAFASIGDGLTDTEATDFYTAVNAYQTTLSRNV
jgi:hypothetical protein